MMGNYELLHITGIHLFIHSFNKILKIHVEFKILCQLSPCKHTCSYTSVCATGRALSYLPPQESSVMAKVPEL